MSFRDLFARYPEKVMDLCLDEASDSDVLYCAVWLGEEDDNDCALCPRNDAAIRAWQGRERGSIAL